MDNNALYTGEWHLESTSKVLHIKNHLACQRKPMFHKKKINSDTEPEAGTTPEMLRKAEDILTGAYRVNPTVF